MQSQIQELVGEIQYLNNEYRAGNPQISDQEYDALLVKLAELDPNNALLKKGVIESAPKTGRKRKLQVPMMSLNKEKSVEAILSWLNKIGLKEHDLLVITPKYNGISLLVDFSTMQTSTRGDGIEGQNCDAHFTQMDVVTSPVFDYLCSGEAIISRDNWDAHFKGKLSPSGLPYKLNNATVAGLLNADEPAEELKYVSFVKYGIHSGANFKNKVDILDEINNNCEIETDYLLAHPSTLNEEMLDEFYRKNNKVYPIDGLVIEVADSKLRSALGYEVNGNPAYSRALKLDKWVEEFDTVITGYSLNISKQGKLKGVVTFDPVIINGTEVKQATFYNALFLFDFCLCLGVNITIKKSGEIIPKIMAVEGFRVPIKTNYKKVSDYDTAYAIAIDQLEYVLEEKRVKFPIEDLCICPSCGSGLEWDEGNVELECKNPTCESMLISKIEHFFTAIGVEEFGRPTIENLYRVGYNTVQKILDIKVDDLSFIEGFGKASADIIISQFNKVRSEKVPFARLLYAWDLFEGKIGEKTIQLIFDNLTDLSNLGVESLVKIKGISTITAECFLKGLELYNDDLDVIPISYIHLPKKVAQNSLKQGFNVCFSGIRDTELEEQIESEGGTVVSGVSKTTTHLIVKDPDQSTSKTVKARELGVKIMTIEQFKAL